MKKILLLATVSIFAATVHAQKLYSHTCTVIPLDEFSMQKVDTTPGRPVANTYLVWDLGVPIKVKFMGHSSKAMRDMIMRYAKEWEQYGNIKFEFVPDNTPGTNIRIKVGEGYGHNSQVGINANNVSQDMQTMNLDTIAFLDYDYYIKAMKAKNIQPNMQDLRKMLAAGDVKWNYKEIRGTVLHEFGHALGLLHEQSYPGAIKWNKDTIYKYYAKTQGWDKAKIDFNVLSVSNQFFTNGTQYDPKSIMHYSVEPWQTTDGYSLPANHELSASDKSIIAALYPKDGISKLRELPRVSVTNFKGLQVVNDTVRGGISIYPSFDLKTTENLGTVYVVAMLVDEYDYYVKDNNNMYNWGGVVAVYPRLRLLPSTAMSYNKDYKNLELFLPYDEIPVQNGRKVKFRFAVVLHDEANGQLVYVMDHFTKNLFSITKN